MKNYIILVLLISSIVVGLGFLVLVNAQTISEEKTFIKCEIDTTLIDSLNLSYDKHCSEEYITIHNWQDITTLNKTTIIADMTSKGFIEQESIIAEAIK